MLIHIMMPCCFPFGTPEGPFTAGVLGLLTGLELVDLVRNKDQSIGYETAATLWIVVRLEVVTHLRLALAFDLYAHPLFDP
jgi:hypothetical protein